MPPPSRVGDVLRRDQSLPPDARGRLWLHDDFVRWLDEDDGATSLRKRARLVLWQMLAQGRPNHVKTVQGAGAGWLRTRLGGNNGAQFYLWWARGGAGPLTGVPLGQGDCCARLVRHHDETDRGLDPGAPAEWMSVDAGDLRDASLAPEFLPAQRAIAGDPSLVRVLKGQPGTGKTTALWLAAERVASGRVLYLTHGRRLAAEAERYLGLLPAGGARFDVMTFAELLDELTGEAAELLMPEVAAERMERLLMGAPRRWHPWEQHFDGLHAEMHAHLVGAALPHAFRDLPPAAGRVLSREAHLRLRERDIGERAARAAYEAAEYLTHLPGFEDVFAGPTRARGALDRVMEGEPLPARLADVSAVIVDEVQDLTLVECALVVELVAALRRAGRGDVSLTVAGDEGQTVRPTDFSWGRLSDLIAARLGAKSEHDLLGNVRSPRTIAAVIQRSWSLYRALDRQARPRGRAEVEVEETGPGRVARCRVTSEAERDAVVEAFRRMPRAALVYPGSRLPEPWREVEPRPWTSDAIKGLDFQVVGVLDASERVAALKRLAADRNDALSVSRARALADHLRVALSRATDTLVLVDVDLDGSAPHRDAAADLCVDEHGEALEGVLGELSVDALCELLARDDAPAADLVLEHHRSVSALLLEDPERALVEARVAVGLLGASRTPGAVSDAGVRAETCRLRGVAALLVAAERPLDAPDRDKLFREANTWLHKADATNEARAALLLRDVIARGRNEVDDALALAKLLPELSRASEADAVLRRGLVRWSRDAAEAPLPDGVAHRRRLVDALDSLWLSLGERHPDLGAHRATARRRVGHALLDEGLAREALSMAQGLDERDRSLEARCHAALGAWAEASRAHLDAGDERSALRCAREAGDLDAALSLARELGDEAQSAAIAWAVALRDLAAGGPEGASLTAAERERVVAAVAEGVGRERPRGRKGPLKRGRGGGA